MDMTAQQALEEMIEVLIRHVGSSNAGSRLSIGTVKQVNEQEGTCNVEREGRPQMHGVRLNAVIDDKVKDWFRIIPAPGSYVLVMDLGDETEGVVMATSKVDKVSMRMGETTVVVNSDGVVINGGTLGGLIKIAELTAKVNELVDAFNTHTHVIASGAIKTQGSASAQTSISPVSVPAVQTKAKRLNKQDYEDEKVKH